MNEQNLQMVFEYLDKISEKIGVGAAQIWPWLIKQQYVDVFGFMLVFIIAATALFFLVKFVIKHWRRDSEGYAIDEADHEVLWSVCLIILFFAVLFSGIGVFFESLDLLNIEYAALQDLMRMINPTQS